MGDLITTALDIVGLLAVAIGFGWWIWQEVSPPAGLVAGGIIVGLVSAVAAAAAERRAEQAQATEPAKAREGNV